MSVSVVSMASSSPRKNRKNRDTHPAPTEIRRRRERTSRLIAKLRGHGLIAKVTRSQLYRVTPRGHRLMSALLTLRHVDFPQVFAAAA
jgi:hypothetical protein